MENDNDNGRGAGLNILEAIPVDRFPHIWKLISANLTRLDDLRNASVIDNDWKMIISRKKLWLFPKVIPFIAKYLDRGDVLNLREVCNACSEGIDQTIENAGLAPGVTHFHETWNTPVWNQTDEDFPYIIGGDDVEVEFPLDVAAFVGIMRNHPRNPIVGRGVVIKDWSSFRPRVRLMESMNDFLPVFGHQLNYICIEFFESELSIPAQSNVIRIALLNTPNLRQLRIASTNCFFIDSSDNDQEIQVPDLPSLRVLQLIYSYERSMNVPILPRDLIRKFSAQLTRFEVRGVDSTHWNSVNWPNLTELHVNVDPICGITYSSLLQVEAPQLAKLYLRIDRGAYRMGKKINVQELLEIGQHFPKLPFTGMKILYK